MTLQTCDAVTLKRIAWQQIVIVTVRLVISNAIRMIMHTIKPSYKPSTYRQTV